LKDLLILSDEDLGIYFYILPPSMQERYMEDGYPVVKKTEEGYVVKRPSSKEEDLKLGVVCYFYKGVPVISEESQDLLKEQ
jgi:hypothetical protein